MAIQKIITFAIGIVGDGSDNTVSINLADDPISFIPPANAAVSPLFDVTKSLPIDVISLNGGSLSISSFTFTKVLGKVTAINLTFGAPLANGSTTTISGYLVYA